MQKSPFPIQTKTYSRHSTPNDRMFATALRCKCLESWLPGSRAFDIPISWNSPTYCRCERLAVGKSTIQVTTRGKRKAPVHGRFYDDLVWLLLLGIFPILLAALYLGTKCHRHAEVFRHRLYLPNRTMSSTENWIQSKGNFERFFCLFLPWWFSEPLSFRCVEREVHGINQLRCHNDRQWSSLQ